jgi:hypothetical protein
MAKSEREISTLLPTRDQYILDTSEFEDVKARLVALQNRSGVENDNDAERPTLRRAETNQQSGTARKQDDDRSTLKRGPVDGGPETQQK